MKDLIILFIFSLILFGCDKVENPYPISSDECIPPSTINRKIIVEDFTGFRCVNCPLASDALQILEKDVYCGRIIPIGVHMIDFFTQPEADPDHPDNFLQDFRTQAGLDYENEFGVFGIPIGVVNRSELNDNILIGFGDWDGKIGELLDIPVNVQLKLKEASYSTSSQEISVEIDALIDNDILGDYNITLYLVEDSILEGQYDGSEIIENYWHRHVLRGTLNGSWGDALFTDAISGDSIRYEGTYTLPSSISSSPNPNPYIDITKCEVVAYIYKSGVGEYEIIQAEKAHVEVQ